MARSSGNSLLNSLRGKIWISTSVLAFFICTFGLISYLVVTLLTNNPFYGVFIPFLFLAFTVIVFGWWLSNELISPIDNVILLSKSLERNSSTSLPKTSGTAETDQLLQTLHRNSQQMQNVITMMDKVASGNIDIALTPLKGSDRLTASFQKLLSKVSESIHAKEDLTKLENEISQVKSEISTVRNGNLNVEIQSEYFHTKEITETINYLLENLTRTISLIKSDSLEAQDSANEVDRSLETLIKKDEQKVQKMNQASATLKQVPGLIEKITEDLTRSAQSARQTIEKTRHGSEISNENSESVSKLRSNLRESINRIQSLNERSHEIAKVARLVDDLASRTNMIALNASIQATEFGEEGHRFVLVSEELERLAARADGTNKQISILNNTILSEISRVEDSLETTLGGIAGLSKYSIETGNVLGELERYIGQFLNLQENLIAVSKDQSEETDEAFETFVSTISETENNIQALEESSSRTKLISQLMKNLQSHSAEFRITPQNNAADSDFYSSKPVEEQINEFDGMETEEGDDERDNFSTDDFNNAKLSTEEFNLMTGTPENEDSPDVSPDEFAPEEEKLDSSEQETIQNKDSDEENFDSDEFNLTDYNSNEFDSDEFNISDYDSRDFDSQELFGGESSNLEEVASKESSAEYDDTEPSSADEFDSKEFLNDDLSIDENHFEDPNKESTTAEEINLLDDDEDDDLLNLNIPQNQDQNPDLPA